MDKITDASIYEEVDDSLQVFEEGIDENPKAEVGYDDGNAQEVPVYNENVLQCDSKVTTAVVCFPNDTPVCKFTSKFEVEHNPDEISEVSTSLLLLMKRSNLT